MDQTRPFAPYQILPRRYPRLRLALRTIAVLSLTVIACTVGVWGMYGLALLLVYGG